MQITTRFNRFFHGVVLKQMYEKNIKLKYHHGNVTAIFYPRGSREVVWSMDYFKQILKSLNPGYPMDGCGPISTRKISTADLMAHIEWTISICTDTPQWVTDQWDDLKLKAGIPI